jgi:hypothetical protein
MRVAANEFGVQALDYAVEGKPAFLFGQPRIEDHLKEQVTQFVFERGKVPGVDRVDNFVSLFQKQPLKGIVALGTIPGTPLRAAQMRYQFDQLAKTLSSQSSS